jgi:hypothetical protein
LRRILAGLIVAVVMAGAAVAGRPDHAAAGTTGQFQQNGTLACPPDSYVAGRGKLVQCLCSPGTLGNPGHCRLIGQILKPMRICPAGMQGTYPNCTEVFR